MTRPDPACGASLGQENKSKSWARSTQGQKYIMTGVCFFHELIIFLFFHKPMDVNCMQRWYLKFLPTRLLNLNGISCHSFDNHCWMLLNIKSFHQPAVNLVSFLSLGFPPNLLLCLGLSIAMPLHCIGERLHVIEKPLGVPVSGSASNGKSLHDERSSLYLEQPDWTLIDLYFLFLWMLEICQKCPNARSLLIF